ncbi:MAG: hypothetical protein NT178_18170 [Proteobacteria bacterium]|nr:hypothetical protein [Pseudomonadota bacterium]
MKSKEWLWLDHIEEQIKEREIPKKLVELTINEPDEVTPEKYGRIAYQKKVENKLARVIFEGNKLITVCLTDKIKKYTKGEQK